MVLPPSRSAVKTTLRVTLPPLGLGYLASILEREEHEVRIVDSLAMDYDLTDVKGAIKKFDPEVVGITATTPAIYDAYKVAEVAKEMNPNCKTVIGGPHATFMARETLDECPYLDIVVKGEGEQTVRELASNGDLRAIKGIAFRENGSIRENGERGFIKDLDEVPFPAYHLFPMEKYKTNGVKFGTMITSRGCPFRCTFCSSSKLCGKIWRGRGPINVLKEIKLLKDEYKIGEIEFLDDTFTLNNKRAEVICELLIKEGTDISWSCSSRVDTINVELVKKLKKAGCHSIYLGVESGSQKSLNLIKKGITLMQAKRAIKIAKKMKLDTVASFIIGIPGETIKAIEKTVKFAKKLNPTLAQFTIFTPYPGTEAYDFAEKKGLLATRDWSKFTTLDPVMNLSSIPPHKLKKLLRGAYLSFYLRPSFIMGSVKRVFSVVKAWMRSFS